MNGILYDSYDSDSCCQCPREGTQCALTSDEWMIRRTIINKNIHRPLTRKLELSAQSNRHRQPARESGARVNSH